MKNLDDILRDHEDFLESFDPVDYLTPIESINDSQSKQLDAIERLETELTRSSKMQIVSLIVSLIAAVAALISAIPVLIQLFG